MNVCISLCTTAVHDISTEQFWWFVAWLEFNVPFQHKYGYIRDENSYDNLPSYPSGIHQSSNVVYWREGRNGAEPFSQPVVYPVFHFGWYKFN